MKPKVERTILITLGVGILVLIIAFLYLDHDWDRFPNALLWMENILIILFLLLSGCLFFFLYRRAEKTYKDAKENSLEELERWKDEKMQEYLSKKRQEEDPSSRKTPHSQDNP